MLKILRRCALVFFVQLSVPFSANAMQVINGKIVLEKISDYDFCQSNHNSDYCHQALLDWVEKNPKDSFVAGKMTQVRMSPYMAIPFFAKAWEQKLGDCKDADVKRAVLSALGLQTERNSMIAAAVEIGLNKCEKEFLTEVVTLAKTNDYALKNTCKLLLKKGALEGVAAKRCNKI